MDSYMTLILLFFGLSLNSCSQIPPRTYYYVDTPMTWTDAQKYCREKYTDLATIESEDDVSRLQPAFSFSYAWIGLHDDPNSWKVAMGNDTNSWRWSATGETSKTGNGHWLDNEPNNRYAAETCGQMSSNGKWSDNNCQTENTFVCYTVTNQGTKTYEFISIKKTWKSAQAYCRERHTDLPTIENDEEQAEVYSAKPADDHIWIGLYRVLWTWSTKSQSLFRNWISSQPNNYSAKQFCVAENPSHKWGDSPCTALFPFICHQDSKLKTVVKMRIQTDADMTDPAVNTQVLQQLDAELRRQGLTDFQLRWNAPPKKHEKEELTHPQCPSDD